MTEIDELRAEVAALRDRIEQRATDDQRSRLSARVVGAAGPSWELGASWMTEVERQLSRTTEQLSRLQLDLNTQFSLIHERFQQANQRFDRVDHAVVRLSDEIHEMRGTLIALLNALPGSDGPSPGGRAAGPPAV